MDLKITIAIARRFTHVPLGSSELSSPEQDLREYEHAQNSSSVEQRNLHYSAVLSGVYESASILEI